MNYAHPYLFIVAVAGSITWTLEYFKIFKPAQIYLPKKYYKPDSRAARGLAFLLGLSGWAFLAYALTQPRLPQGFAKNKIKVNDIYFVLDVSRSMLAEDFKPNRLEAAKKKILEFVELRPTDRIGIVMFSDNAFTLLPLSTDLDLIKTMVSQIKVGFLGMGTNIGDALGLAVARGAKSLAENKVIILLTDGVSNVGNMTPLQAARQSSEQGIRVYTIGIGRKENQKILKMGNTYQRLPGGSVDLETLEEIAGVTGAKSFYAASEQDLREVLSEIQKLEKTEIDSSSRMIYKELYHKYLLIGVILLAMAELGRRLILKEAL